MIKGLRRDYRGNSLQLRVGSWISVFSAESVGSHWARVHPYISPSSTQRTEDEGQRNSVYARDDLQGSKHASQVLVRCEATKTILPSTKESPVLRATHNTNPPIMCKITPALARPPVQTMKPEGRSPNGKAPTLPEGFWQHTRVEQESSRVQKSTVEWSTVSRIQCAGENGDLESYGEKPRKTKFQTVTEEQGLPRCLVGMLIKDGLEDSALVHILAILRT